MAKETEQEIGAPAKSCESAVRLLADLRLSLSVSKPDRSAPCLPQRPLLEDLEEFLPLLGRQPV